VTVDESDKPSGTGYALVDWRLSRMEKQLEANAVATVPVGIYNVNQQVITEKLAELLKADAVEQAARVAADIAIHARIDASEDRQEANRIAIEKARKQFWLTVSAGILVAIVNLFGNPIGQALASLVTHK
jgi:predicted metal-dependent phosphoesterase TrpH